MPREAVSVVAPSVATASAVDFFSAAASVAFFGAATFVASFSAVALETAAASFVMLDVPGVPTGDAAADEPGRGVEVATGANCPIGGGPLMGHPSLQSNLLLLYRGWSSLL
jgi:hypothetical protein